MDTSDFYGIYRDLAEQLGIETAKKIHEHWKGAQVTFPLKLYSSEYVERQVKERNDGTNSKLLAQEFGYAERYIKNLLSRGKQINNQKSKKFLI